MATLTCNLPPPPPPPLTPDQWNNNLASAAGEGWLNCGQGLFLNGTTYPAGTEDWFLVTFTNFSTCSGGTVTLTASSGIQFDVLTNASTTLVAGVTSAYTITTPGMYFIRIHGVTPSTVGTWSLSIVDQ